MCHQISDAGKRLGVTALFDRSQRLLDEWKLARILGLRGRFPPR